MKQFFLSTLFLSIGFLSNSQKIDSIYFHLYTDSLKKGTHNYINVDGKTSDGKWKPLTAKDLTFTSSYGTFEGTELVLPDNPTVEKLTVKAILKSDPKLWREITIWIKKKPDDEMLPTNEEVLKKQAAEKQQIKTRKLISIFSNSIFTAALIPLSLRRQVLHDQLLLNLPRAGRQQG